MGNDTLIKDFNDLKNKYENVYLDLVYGSF